MKRRFLAPLPEFRSILYTSSNSVTLVCLSSDGRCIYLLCTLQGTLKVLHKINNDNERISSDKITAIKVVKGDRLVYGTFNGQIKIVDLKTGNVIEDENRARYNSDQPILQIANENVHVDSDGKLFVNGLIVLDDGILQPCGLFIDDKSEIHSIYLVKFRTIYKYEILSKQLQTFNLDSSVCGYFCAIEIFIESIDGSAVNYADTFTFKTTFLILITDQGELFALSSDNDDNETFSIKKISSSQSLEQCPSQDDNESESENENENDDSEYANENNDTESSFEKKIDQYRIFGLIKYPRGNEKYNNHLIKLNVNLLQKRAHLEVIKHGISINNNISDDVIVEFPLVKVVCPLCTSASSTRTQTLPLNTLSCLQGHPLTICSLSATPIPSITSFRCRSCGAAYSCNPNRCHFCPGLLTKIN